MRCGHQGLGSRAARGHSAHSAHSRPASVLPPRGCSARRVYRKAWRRRALATPARMRTSQDAERGHRVPPQCLGGPRRAYEWPVADQVSAEYFFYVIRRVSVLAYWHIHL